ncbi:MAG: EAL domain-containing protein [Sideroxydans sp.]|nr:EAL domain-containing protein [Sideroxydans sp.]
MYYVNKQSFFIRRMMWLAVFTLVFAILMGAYLVNKMVTDVGVQAKSDSVGLLQFEDVISDAESNLASQVQAWKDCLLHSDDPIQLQLHRAAMLLHAAAVENAFDHALELGKEVDIDGTNITVFTVRHRALTEEYRNALDHLDGKNKFAFRQLNEQMQGRDQQLLSDMHELRQGFDAELLNRIAKMGSVEAGEAGQSMLYLIALWGVLLPLGASIIFFLVFRSLRKVALSDARVRSIYNSIGDAVVVIDLKGNIESINETAQKLTGWSYKESHGRPIAEVFQLYDVTGEHRVASPAERVLLEGKSIPMSDGMLLKHRDGSTLVIEDSAAAVYDEWSEMFAVVMVFHDVSQRYAILNALQQQRELFRKTFDMAGVGMAHLSTQGRWLRVNKKLSEITGYTEEELLAASFQGVTHPDDLAKDMYALGDLMAHRTERYQTEKRYIRKDGEVVWVAVTVSVVWKEDGSADYRITIIEDIQARKQAERSALAAHDQYRALFEQLPQGVILFAENLLVVAFNEEALRLLEYDAATLSELSVFDLETVDDDEAIEQRKNNLLKTGRDDFESYYRTRSGHILNVDVSIRLVTLPDGRKVFQTLFQDITARKEAESQIEHLAYHDQLTGLANRRLLEDRLEQAISSAVRRDYTMGLLYLDLDHFKDVNDSLGHHVGDLLLQLVSQRLLKCIRAEDTLARMGGDEFVVMLGELHTAEDAARTAEKILVELGLPLQLGDDELRISPSIGISMFPQDGHDAESLLKHADVALYQAKQSGRATYRFYTQALHDRSVERMRIERLLHKAIPNQELTLHYQPQIDLKSGAVVGCEALIRWQHDALGMVSPAQFIPVAEQSNLIMSIGEWVIWQTCTQAKRWQDQGWRFRVSFNVSARQFLQPEKLLSCLQSAVSETGVDANMMEMELTESLLLDSHSMNSILSQVRALGIHLALDDFGTGYSSLSYLRRFPIGVLKIDRSFVSDADRDADDAEMVKTIIGMAHNLRMTLVAEGVETAEQAQLLRAQGCEVGQGYFYSKPLPVNEFEDFLKTRV